MPNTILKHSIEHTIPFFDVDSLEIAWHGHYIKYFELARCALLDKLQYSYCDMRDSGYSWPVIEMKVRYAAPAVFNQTVVITASLVEYENRLKINFVILDKKSQKRLTRGHSIQVAVDMKTEEMCFASPKILLEKIQDLT
jgi:acyl-CoA thioester hydrolase